jgi:hypothetical protein
MEKDTLVLPSLSPVGDKPISVRIDARCTSADGGVVLFQDVERRLNLANRLAACLHDPRQPGKIMHPQGLRMKTASKKRQHIVIVPGSFLATSPHADAG